MASETDNHNLQTPPRDTSGWEVTWQDNFDRIERYLEVRDLEETLGDYTPHWGAKFFAIDTGAEYIGDGESWSQISSGGGEVGTITAQTGSFEQQLTIPVADSTTGLDGQEGSIAWLTGVDDPAGVYRHNGTGWALLSGGGSGTGASALSELTIDTGKDWQGFDVTNVGLLGANRVTSTTAPVNPEDVIRFGDVGDLVAGHTHNNDAHSVNYSEVGHTHSGDDLDPITVTAGSHTADATQLAYGVVRNGATLGGIDNAGTDINLTSDDPAVDVTILASDSSGITVSTGGVSINTDVSVTGEVSAPNLVTADDLTGYVSRTNPSITGNLDANANDLTEVGEVNASAVRASDGLTIPELAGVPEDNTNFYFRTDLA